MARLWLLLGLRSATDSLGTWLAEKKASPIERGP